MPALRRPHRFPRRLIVVLACNATMALAGPAHVHGQASLEIVVEPRSVTLRLDIPQDNLLGHERTPRTDAERQAAARVLTRLQAGSGLFGWPADAQCRLAGTEIHAPQLQPGAVASGRAGHADVEASFRFECARTDGLRQVDLGGLFDAFTRLQRLQAQVAAAQGQFQASVQRPARMLAWGR